jgi:predicted MFS family arabinose efflux permease
MENRDSASGWLAVALLAVSTFASVTTEFLPIGLLTNIAASLHVTEGLAGLMVTMPGLVAAVTGPLLIVVAGRLDRRHLLLTLSLLLVASNALAALAPNLAVMLCARVLLGVVVGGFWTFVPGAAAFLVAPAQQARAISYVLAGISVATVAGIPAGALIGNLAGWRAAFVVSAVLAGAVLILQWRILPSMPPARALVARDLLVPLTQRGPRLVLAIGLVLMTAHFVAYTYLRPVLQQAFGMTGDAISSLLLVYGVAGLAGTFLAGQAVLRSVTFTALAAALTVGGVLLFARTGGHGAVAATMTVIAWGGAFGAIPVAMTTWMQQAAFDAPEAGQALLVTFIQVAVAAGAALGGFVVDARGIPSALLLGGALALLAAGMVAVLARGQQHALLSQG